MTSESDIELIDAYLDGDTTPAQKAQVKARLAHDPDFTAALTEQRSQRAIRSTLWQAVQPDEATADLVADRIVSEVHRRQTTRAFRHFVRIAGAIAACITLGFVAGWVGRGRAVKLVVAPTHPAIVAADTHPATAHATTTSSSGGVFVALTNENGDVTALQYFSRPEDAGQFVKDIDGIQVRRQRIQQGRVVMADDKKQVEF